MNSTKNRILTIRALLENDTSFREYIDFGTSKVIRWLFGMSWVVLIYYSSVWP